MKQTTIPKHKPEYCVCCPAIPLNICGKVVAERGTSGSIHYVKKPDNRCVIKG